MSNKELLAKIKAEIERLYNGDAPKHDQQCNFDDGYFTGIDAIAQFIDTLESEKPIDPEAAMKELDEKIALVKQRGTWDGVDVDRYMDEVRGREPEKPTKEGLEAEMDKFFETMPVLEHENIFEDTFKNIARHFYDLGCTRTAEKYDEIEYNRQRAEGRVLPGFEDESKGIPGKDFVPVEWVETLEMYGKWKIVKLEEDGSSEIPNDLEEAAESFAFKSLDEVVLYGCTLSGRRACFIAGAKWQENKDQETIKLAEDHAFLAGAEWQKEQDLAEMAQSKSPLSVAYANRCFENGKQAMKEQMMKEAVEGVVTYDNFGNNVVRAGVFNKDLEYGDKVRLIIISNTDEK